MKKTLCYGVYNAEDFTGKVVDNDMIDWFENYADAKAFAIDWAAKDGIEITIFAVDENSEYDHKIRVNENGMIDCPEYQGSDYVGNPYSDE